MDVHRPAGSERLPSPIRDSLAAIPLASSSASRGLPAAGNEDGAPFQPSFGPKRTVKSKDKVAQRASHACAKCRRQKLRCLGGFPCDRCVRTNSKCIFQTKDGEPDVSFDADAAPAAASANAAGSGPFNDDSDRSRHLEYNLASLIAGLGNNTHGGSSDRLSHLDLPAEVARQRRHSDHPSSSRSSRLPPPTHTRPLSPPRIGVNLQSTVSPPGSFRLAGQSSISPASSGLVARAADSATIVASGATGPNNATKDGLQASATESLYEAPFRSLMRQLFDYRTSIFHELEDPINTDILEEDMAETLFQFFVDHCHPFLPIVNVSLEAAFVTIRQSPPLFSAIIAIASRFYSKYQRRQATTSFPELDSTAPMRLANLAEAHLGQTLLRRDFALSDVQAILLMAAWNLPGGGWSGPDAWVVTGHAARVARRLGVHKVLAQAAETARTADQESDEWRKLQAFIPQWRTWLSWFTFDGFLSLGFGRPQSTQFETVDETGFLQMRLHQILPRPGSAESVSLYGDVYIAGQVQLTQIGRDLINWSEMLADPEKAIYADPRRATVFRDRDLSLKNMFRELNGRLEEWSKLWVWTARVAKLQSDHLRLCLNSYALKAGADEDDETAKYLRIALNAATNTIQTHYESSQTDLGLSFATDAAVFIIRIAKSPSSVQAALKIEIGVLAHYSKMSIELLEASDLSETLLGTHLAKTIHEIGKAAKAVVDEPVPAFDANASFTASDFANADSGTRNMDADFNFDDFFQIQNEMDLKYFLGLPSDGEGLVTDASGMGAFTNASGSFPNEFAGGSGGLGVGASSAERWNASLSLEALGSLLQAPGNHAPLGNAP